MRRICFSKYDSAQLVPGVIATLNGLANKRAPHRCTPAMFTTKEYDHKHLSSLVLRRDQIMRSRLIRACSPGHSTWHATDTFLDHL